MPADTVLTASHLSIVGIVGDLATLLIGKTVAAVSVEVDALVAAAIAKGVASGGLVSYTIDGQSGSIDLSTLIRARDALRRMASRGGALRLLPVEFGA